jgi:hypothetical protein
MHRMIIITLARMTKHTLVSLVLVFLTFAQCCSAAKILILGMPFYSHLSGPANVGKFLQSQGHDTSDERKNGKAWCSIVAVQWLG